MSYEGTPDKSKGKKFTVTPAEWNSVTPAGSIRSVKFQLFNEEDQEKVNLLAITINGGKELK